MSIQMTPVGSKMAEAIGHDPERNELHVLHLNGRTSIYGSPEQPVHATIAEAIIGSDSPGRSLHAMIINKFPHRYL